MSFLKQKKAYAAAAVTAVATALGYVLGGLDLAGHALFSSALGCAVGIMWLETSRMRHRLTPGVADLGKRLQALEARTGRLHQSQQTLARDIGEAQAATIEQLSRELVDAHAAGVERLSREVDAAHAASVERLSREIGDAHAGSVEQLSHLADALHDGVLETVRKAKANSQENTRRLYAKIDSLLALYRDIDPEQGLPPLHGWAAGADLQRYLYMQVVEEGRSRILECGSGSTTVILAYAARSLGSAHVTALEHDSGYAALTRRMLAERGLTGWASVIDAPLVEVKVGEDTARWYDTSAIPEGEIDMLLVDGPPGGTGPRARYPAMPLLADRLSKNALVVLDDARRPDERAIGRQWATEHEDFESKMLPHDYGTFVLQRSAEQR